MKAYLVDTPNKQVTEVEWDGDYRSIHTLIRASPYTAVRINEHGDSVFVDDEGLINGNPYGWFVHENYLQPLRGYGLVLGLDDDTGDSTAPHVSIDELRAQLSFPDDAELAAPETFARAEVQAFNTLDELLTALGLGKA